MAPNPMLFSPIVIGLCVLVVSYRANRLTVSQHTRIVSTAAVAVISLLGFITAFVDGGRMTGSVGSVATGPILVNSPYQLLLVAFGFGTVVSFVAAAGCGAVLTVVARS